MQDKSPGDDVRGNNSGKDGAGPGQKGKGKKRKVTSIASVQTVVANSRRLRAKTVAPRETVGAADIGEVPPPSGARVVAAAGVGGQAADLAATDLRGRP